MPSTDIMTALRIAAGALTIEPGQETSGQASGMVRVKDLRPPLWRGTLRSVAMLHAQALQAQALIEDLNGAEGTFYAWNPIAQFPQADPRGATFGASEVTILALGVDNRSLSLKGLPEGYVLTRGDHLSFDFGSSPVRRALHRITAASVTADEDGETAVFSVYPHIRAGAAADAAVTLVRATAEVFVVPKSFALQTQGRARASISIDVMQVP